MNDLLLCSRPTSADDLCRNTGIALQSRNCMRPPVIPAFTPYLLGDTNSAAHGALQQLVPTHQSRELTHIALSFGDDTTVALAEIGEKLRTDGASWLSSSTGLYAKRVDSFARSARDYQLALMKFREATSASTSSVSRTLAKQQAQAAYNAFQTEFHREVGLVTKNIRTRRGIPLDNFNRAINIANSSRSIAKLQVANQIEAHNLVRFGKYAKFLGNGMAVIDFGNRVGNIHNTYREGGNWQRELFIESSSFAATGILGMGTAVGINLLLFATPFGWAGLIIGGIALAGVATAASIYTDKAIHTSGGDIYDNILQKLEI